MIVFGWRGADLHIKVQPKGLCFLVSVHTLLEEEGRGVTNKYHALVSAIIETFVWACGPNSSAIVLGRDVANSRLFGKIVSASFDFWETPFLGAFQASWGLPSIEPGVSKLVGRLRS